MPLRSFGCSFTAGTDLFCEDNVWSNIVAEKLDIWHVNHAQAGIGNLQIAESVMLHSMPGDICVINWSWIDRFDFVDPNSEQWKTILPVDVNDYTKTYYRYLHSQYRDMLTNLMHAASVIDFLERHNIPFVMTVIDHLWMQKVQQSWHESCAIDWMQSRLQPYLCDFQGQDLLNWARSNDFPISDTWHPLDLAHEKAAELMLPIIESILRKV